jgi:hypothetical protein
LSACWTPKLTVGWSLATQGLVFTSSRARTELVLLKLKMKKSTGACGV